MMEEETVVVAKDLYLNRIRRAEQNLKSSWGINDGVTRV